MCPSVESGQDDIGLTRVHPYRGVVDGSQTETRHRPHSWEWDSDTDYY